MTELRGEHWEVRCTGCGVRMVVEGMVPFYRNDEGREIPYQPGAPGINGFWEDYFCPQHLIVRRRAVVVSRTRPIDPDMAWKRYDAGQGWTVPVPECPRCGREMEAGYLLDDLPPRPGANIEVARFVTDRYTKLRDQFNRQRRFVEAGHIPSEMGTSALRQTVKELNAVHAALLRRQGGKPDGNGVFSLYQEGNWGTAEWDAAAEKLERDIQRAEQSLAQMERGSTKGGDKRRSRCPLCEEGTLYLADHHLL